MILKICINIIYCILILGVFSCNQNKYQFTPHPGIKNQNLKLIQQLSSAQAKRKKHAPPRTKYLNKDGSAKYTNRLYLETSPYLLQHAHNPVNWYPWGKEAFLTAQKKGLPILLSIGYSTCHWCHVMEEESFENFKIAKYLNENYIAIKVDREERPDIDSIYMSAVQAINGSGGWPMTIWITPSKKPIFAATYLPPFDGSRGVKYGFLSILKQLSKIYKEKPTQIKRSSNQLAQYISKKLENNTPGILVNHDIIKKSIDFFKSRFDKKNGGLIGKPKFPSSLPIKLFLRYYKTNKDPRDLQIVTKTLLKMNNGGMYDHVAGGFHRYSTDQKWLVPHFEKMLYDNALLALDYIEAYQVSKNSKFKRIAQEILDYVIKDMTDQNGAFYSATDADSIGPTGKREEGYYYTWTPQEIDKTLNKNEANFIQDYYNITKRGNFEDMRTILSTPVALPIIAKKYHLDLLSAKKLLYNARQKLYKKRLLRKSPLRDEKILAAWNGLMISAFSKAAFVFSNLKYKNVAIKASKFIYNNLFFKGNLYRSYKNNQRKHIAYLDDYAFYIASLIDLYQITGNPIWFTKALTLENILEKKYQDKNNGGFFMTSNTQERLLAREKPRYDGAEPSGNSIQAMNLLRLYHFTSDELYLDSAKKLFKIFSNSLSSNPASLSYLILALDFYYNTTKEIIIVYPDQFELKSSKLITSFKKHYLPNSIFTIISNKNLSNKLTDKIKIIGKKYIKSNLPTAYICQQKSCSLPTTSLDQFKKLLKNVNE